jgi:integrase
METTKTTWQKTKTAHLLRNSESGKYYARLYRDGKEIWKSLKTKSYPVAVAKLAEEAKIVRQSVKQAATVEKGHATVETVAKLYLERERLRQDLKPSMKHYRAQCVGVICKSDLAKLQPKNVTEQDCLRWASRLGYSGTRFNNIVDTLRSVFQLSIENGLTFRNPAERISKRKPSKKKLLELPSREEFASVVESMRGAGGWCSNQAADLVEFLAGSGCRLEEAAHVKWSDVEEKTLWIHGGSTGTKNSESRRIPVIPALRKLLDDLKANPRYFRGDREDHVLAITECAKAIDAACERTGVTRFTHHDLRHLFATRCIESGVDIPTLSRWLGHKDGGALAMKTYGHLRDQHSQAMAAKVI